MINSTLTVILRGKKIKYSKEQLKDIVLNPQRYYEADNLAKWIAVEHPDWDETDFDTLFFEAMKIVAFYYDLPFDSTLVISES